MGTLSVDIKCYPQQQCMGMLWMVRLMYTSYFLLHNFKDKDSDIAAIPPPDPLGFRPSGEEDFVHVPYPWFDDRLSEEQMKQRSVEFYEKMNKRRSVRKISDEDIPLEVVENLIRTAADTLGDQHVIHEEQGGKTNNFKHVRVIKEYDTKDGIGNRHNAQDHSN
ncbi:hypothetical protein OS493_002026 [Desmophyllum pertusum]|uniref:Uncharacterized protein n=1 Tax=Desmophyllum pertusum TaxID=174260 RepID=A0A9W9Z871_9CNID|nr:hypothetical protein OS493_002026 [Desmophyllum pertusum]